MTFENKAGIIEHMESIHQLDVKCQYCDYTSFYKGHLESHLIKKHSKNGSFEHLNCSLCTGKSLSEALIFVSTNPQYDNRLFIEIQVQCMKIPSSNREGEHVLQKVELLTKIYLY